MPASNMEETWKRLVRTVKVAQCVLLEDHVPCEELTSTVCLEVEALVNSRPLTDVPSDPDAPEALTPFHFIISSFPSESPYRNDVM
jgi:hypothetical protein